MTSRPSGLALIVAASLAGPAAGQTPPPPAPILLNGPAALGAADPAPLPLPLAAWDAPLRPRGVGLAVTEHVALVASAGKERPQREGLSRRLGGPGGLSRASRSPRLSLVVRW